MRVHKGPEGKKDGVTPQIIAHDNDKNKLEWRSKRYKEGREEEATSPDKSLKVDGGVEMDKDIAQKRSTTTPGSLKKKVKKGVGNQRVTNQKRNGTNVVHIKSSEIRATKHKLHSSMEEVLDMEVGFFQSKNKIQRTTGNGEENASELELAATMGYAMQPHQEPLNSLFGTTVVSGIPWQFQHSAS